jgi:serine/threonine-protein kinase
MTEASTSASFSPGQVVAGRYELVELLGQGGHGAVYRAIQRPLEREVAIKVILVEALFSDGMLERFTREAALVQRLEHPNTVRLYDFGTTEQGLPYIVFELLRGRTLEQEIARGTLTPLRVGRVATQVLKSLMEAHALGIVHRDIKPSNVLLVDYSGETDFVKVLDFGVARNVTAAASGEAITHAGQIIGTPSYMAPEQVHGRTVGPAADLYSLGLVMSEAASGERVYGEGSAMDIWMKQTAAEPVPLPHLVVSSALGPVIARATRKDPRERYPSAEDMLHDLERALLACGGPTDPLAKPLARAGARPGAPEVSPITERLTRDPSAPPPGTSAPPPVAPLTPLAISPPTPTHAQSHLPSMPGSLPGSLPGSAPGSQPSSSPSSLPSSSSSTGTSAAIVILGVVAIGSLLLAAAAGTALYMSRRAPAGATPAPSSFTPATHAKLGAVTPERTERRLREAGWAIVPSSPVPPVSGFKGTYLTATRGTLSALVHLYEYDSESTAAQTETVLRMTEGPVVERDGGRVLYVFVTQDPGKSRALFDELVR